LKPEVATRKQSTAVGFLMDSKVKVCIAKHLGWMRDLRGDKNLTLPQAISAVMQHTPVSAASSSQKKSTSQSSVGKLSFINHLFLIIIDVYLYLCLSGWSVWKHMV
jgi:hypothetical protein